VPTDLRIVAVLFFLSGLLAALEVLISFLHGRVSLNIGVIGLLICAGLLHFSRGWRTCALIYLWFGVIGLPLILLYLIPNAGSLNITISIFSQRVSGGATGFVFLTFVLVWVVLIWQIRVLTRPHIRALFGLHENNSTLT
jgi:hypothetical protein